jgi:hypothetical protein
MDEMRPYISELNLFFKVFIIRDEIINVNELYCSRFDLLFSRMKSTTHLQLIVWKRLGIDENENHMIKLITWMKLSTCKRRYNKDEMQ